MSTHWQTIDAELGLYRTDYAFGKLRINTLVVRLDEGKLLVAGPGTKVEDAVWDELDTLGEVAAVVSPGPFHHMGFPEWKQRYPEARLFAGAGGLKRIPGQHKGLELGLEGLDALAALLPDHIVAQDVAGMRQPDLQLMVRDGSGKATWFTNEVITNEPSLPSHLGVWLTFKLAGVSTGLTVNNFTRMAFGGKKGPIGAYFREQLVQHPPGRLVPSHGQVLEAGDLGEQLSAVFDAKL